MQKIKVAIIGTGNIGIDLLMKINRTPYMDLVAFVGRNENSKGIGIAKSLGIRTSCDQIDFFIQNKNICDVVYDCTSSDSAKVNAKVFSDQGIKVVDLTPSKVGVLCVPSINNDVFMFGNINMITCGGQASLPLLNVVSNCSDSVEYIEIVSQIASKSAGMATRINIDSYIHTTEEAIRKFTTCSDCKVILNLNPAEPCVNMQTTMFIKATNINYYKMMKEIENRVEEIRTYVPYYELIIPPTLNDEQILILSVRVKGLGDYLPSYAGNLDIINAAAIKATESFFGE